MDILYSGDENIREGVLLSSLSIVEATPGPITFWVMSFEHHDPGTGRTAHRVQPAFVERLERLLASERADVTVRYVDATVPFAERPPIANINSYFTPGCMLRLYADLVDELPGRILYLDNDVLCRRDVTSLWETDLEGAEIGGVLDNIGSWFFRRDGLRRAYLNSGVLLIDLDEVRSSGLFARCRGMCAGTKMFMPDQTALNKLARRKTLPRRYNEQRRLHDDTVLQHFTTHFRLVPCPRKVCVKPWDVERVHRVLRLHEYDALLERFQGLRAEVIDDET